MGHPHKKIADAALNRGAVRRLPLILCDKVKLFFIHLPIVASIFFLMESVNLSHKKVKGVELFLTVENLFHFVTN